MISQTTKTTCKYREEFSHPLCCASKVHSVWMSHLMIPQLSETDVVHVKTLQLLSVMLYHIKSPIQILKRLGTSGPVRALHIQTYFWGLGKEIYGETHHTFKPSMIDDHTFNTWWITDHTCCLTSLCKEWRPLWYKSMRSNVFFVLLRIAKVPVKKNRSTEPLSSPSPCICCLRRNVCFGGTLVFPNKKTVHYISPALPRAQRSPWFQQKPYPSFRGCPAGNQPRNGRGWSAIHTTPAMKQNIQTHASRFQTHPCLAQACSHIFPCFKPALTIYIKIFFAVGYHVVHMQADVMLHTNRSHILFPIQCSASVHFRCAAHRHDAVGSVSIYFFDIKNSRCRFETANVTSLLCVAIDAKRVQRPRHHILGLPMNIPQSDIQLGPRTLLVRCLNPIHQGLYLTSNLSRYAVWTSMGRSTRHGRKQINVMLVFFLLGMSI